MSTPLSPRTDPGPLGARRTIGPALYLLLALALVGMVLLSILVNERIQRSVFESVVTSALWSAKFDDIATLGGLVSAADAPGNEVFSDGDPVGERVRMQAACDSALARLALLRSTLPAGLPPRDSNVIAADLDRLAVTVPGMRQAAESVFASFAARDPRRATRQMAQMDRRYARALGAIRTLRADLVAAQGQLLDTQRRSAESASRLLRLTGIALFALAVGGGWLGFRLAREAERQAAEREATMRLVTDARGALEEAHTRLTAAHRELESFSYSVAHDLRAPLRSIHGFSEALEQDSGEGLNDEGRAHLARIRAASLRMGALIDDLLRLSKVSRQPLTLAPLDLSRMAADVVAELRTLDPDRRVAVTIEPGLRADADAALVRVLLQNLLGNAWKFTRHTADATIHVGRDTADRWVPDVFLVRDNGAGFDMKYATKLFGAFQRMHTTGEFEGTGIGLATVHRIVERHGGGIW
ncbi:MAG TPA: ATP-binding protein, partial [Gemmatimonadales bacterium]|nr:ATP-binding protein [Gemmatimonadales bacterium]